MDAGLFGGLGKSITSLFSGASSSSSSPQRRRAVPRSTSEDDGVGELRGGGGLEGPIVCICERVCVCIYST